MLEGILRFVRYAGGLVGLVGLIGTVVRYSSRGDRLFPSGEDDWLWMSTAVLGLSLVASAGVIEFGIALVERIRGRRV
jgi:hypothetical protein